jgi:inorganic pyrophosphatase
MIAVIGCCQGEKDDKIIAVCADDPEYRNYSDISELSPHRLQEIKRFFEDCILQYNSSIDLLLHAVVYLR